MVKILKILLLNLVGILIFVGSSEAASYISRSLTDEEMREPENSFHMYSRIDYFTLADYDAPVRRPRITWNIGLQNILPLKYITDSRGNTWITDRSPFYRCFFGIMRIDENGNERCVPTYIDHGRLSPILNLEGALIFKKNLAISDDSTLACYSTDGDHIWESQYFDCTRVINKARRIQDNRLILPIGKTNSGEFAIFSIENGELLSKIRFPDWNDHGFDLIPLNTPDNGWIGFQTDFVVKFDVDLNVEWRHKIQEPLYKDRFAISKDGTLLLGEDDALRAINVNDGSIKWENPAFMYAVPAYRVSSNSFLVYCFSLLIEIDLSGQVLNSTTIRGGISSLSRSNLVIYKDNNILYCNGQILRLENFHGDLIWELNKYELEAPDASELRFGIIQAAPDGRIVFSFSKWNSNLKWDRDNTMLLSLR